ncbi:hypothetical protein [Ruegeria sp.]|uniref:hypothetical protein n=1 Tax=Ruegeria sp. TaxID=1879320 RepID=UPI003B5B0FA2
MNLEALLLAFVTFWLGIVAYLVQKHFDRREQIRARHFEIYIEMLEAICELANAHSLGGIGKEDALSKYATAKMKFAVVASDETMKKFVAFDKRISSGVRVPHEEFDDLLSKLMKAIRKENLGETIVTNEELITVTPYGRSLRDE